MENGIDSVIDVLPGMVWTALPDGRVDFVNRAWCDYSGMSPGEAHGDGWLAIVHPGDLPTLQEQWRRILASAAEGDMQARLCGRDGTCRVFVLRVRPLTDAAGRITRWCALSEPASAACEGDRQPREPDFRAIADSIPGSVVIMTPAGEVEYVNRQAMQYRGLPLEVLRLWRTPASTIHPDELPAVIAAWTRSVETAEPFDLEFRIRRADGVYRWFRVRGLPLRDHQGRVACWFILDEDIHDSRQARVMLAAEKQLLDMVARNCPRLEILDTFCRLAEGMLPGCRCSLMLPDPSGMRVALCAGPHLPPDLMAESRGAPETQRADHAQAGCFHGQLMVPDLAAERGEADGGWVASVMAAGLRSCWSMPIAAAVGGPLGALAVWRGQPWEGLPQEELATIEKLTQIASVTLERLRSQDSLAQALEEIRASETRLRNTVNAVPAVVWTAAPDGGVEFLNRRWDEYTGMTPEQARGNGWASAVHPSDAAALAAYWHGLLESGQPGEYEARLRRNDGSYRWFLIRATPQLDEAGRVLKWHGSNTDIDCRKRAEMLLAGEKRLLGMLAGGSPLNTILEEVCRLVEASLGDAHCSIVLVDAKQSRSGRSGTPILLQPGVAPNLPADLLEGTLEHAAEADANPIALAAISNELVVCADLASEERWEAWRRMALSSGIHAHWSRPITSSSGMPVAVLSIHGRHPGKPSTARHTLVARFAHLVSIAIDSTRREVALKQSEAFLAQAQRLSQTGTFAWRVDGDEIIWSDEIYRIGEVEPGTTPTFDLIYSRVHPEDAPSLNELFRRQRIDGRDFEHEHRLLMPDGRVKYVHLVAQARRDEAGSLEYTAALQDITQRRLSEEAFATIRAELSHVARVASLGALTASIAHEVSQPLAGIITNANTCLHMLAADPPNVDGARETARRTIRDGNRASEVIQRLRSLFARREPAADPVDLNEAAREVVAMLLGELQRNSVIVRPDFADGLPPARGDRVQLQQVIVNLIRNALDAVQGVNDRPRHLRVGTRLDADGQLQLDVEDNGGGFDSQDADRLFQAFYTTKATGMGMGLSVSRSIIENHGGRIWAKPNEGPGARFSFVVPRCLEPQAPGHTAVQGAAVPQVDHPVEMP